MRNFMFIVILILSALARAEGELKTVNLSVAVDLLGPFSMDQAAQNKIEPRSAEFQFYGPIDHVFDGVLNFAGHYDEGEFLFGVHEGYIGSTKLIPQSKFKIGKFFLGVGRLNGFHQHDWPFISAPKVHREFLVPGSENSFQAEGASDSGAEYSWLLPTDRFYELTLGITNGYCFGHCHKEGERPPLPLVYLHPTTFFETEAGGGYLIGASFLARTNASGQKTQLYGLDLTYKRREARTLALLVQSELYYQVQSAPEADRTEKAGFYVYPEYGISENISVGFRVDGYSHLNMYFETTGERRKDLDYAVVPTLTYRPSEFSTLRIAYSHEVDTTQGSDDVNDRQLQLQAVFLLGAHPPHPF